MDALTLRHFLAIAERRSITGAADRLGIAQPSLSQQLLRLEDELGVRLFVRTARGVAPTEAGQIFEAHARSILQGIDRAREDVIGTSDDLKGCVVIGLPLAVSELLGVRLILEVQRRHPGIRLRLEEAMSGHVRGWLENNQIDLALLYDATGFRQLITRTVVAEQLCLVGAPGAFAGDAKAGIDLAEIIALQPRLILPGPRHSLRQFVEKAEPGLSRFIHIEVDSLLHMKTLVMQGHGHSILSSAAVFDYLRDGRLSVLAIKHASFMRTIQVARNADHVLTRASAAVEAVLLALIEEMVGLGVWSSSLDPDQISATTNVLVSVG